MHPSERQLKIVQRIDRLEADACRVYRALESLRLELQAEWRVLPDGTKWTEEKHEATRYSAKEQA